MKENAYVEALKEPLSIAGGVISLALTLAWHNPAPLLAGMVVEAAYLLFVPETEWYGDRLRRRGTLTAYRDSKIRHAQIAPALQAEMQTRFTKLDLLRQQALQEKPSKEVQAAEVLSHLNTLFDSFLQLAVKEKEFRDMLEPLLAQDAGQTLSIHSAPSSAIPQMVLNAQSAYDQNRTFLRMQAAQERDPEKKSQMTMSMAALDRKRDQAGKIGKMLMNLNYQIQLVEETIYSVCEDIKTVSAGNASSQAHAETQSHYVPMAERMQSLIRQIDSEGASDPAPRPNHADTTAHRLICEDEAGIPQVAPFIPDLPLVQNR